MYYLCGKLDDMKEVTIEVNGEILEIEGYYYEGEKETLYLPDGTGYEGIDPYFEIVNIKWCGKPVTELVFSLYNQHESLEDKCLKELQNYYDYE